MLRGLAALHAIEATNVITRFIKQRFARLTSVLLEDEIGRGKDKAEIQDLGKEKRNGGSDLNIRHLGFSRRGRGPYRPGRRHPDNFTARERAYSRAIEPLALLYDTGLCVDG